MQEYSRTATDADW